MLSPRARGHAPPWAGLAVWLAGALLLGGCAPAFVLPRPPSLTGPSGLPAAPPLRVDGPLQVRVTPQALQWAASASVGVLQPTMGRLSIGFPEAPEPGAPAAGAPHARARGLANGAGSRRGPEPAGSAVSKDPSAPGRSTGGVFQIEDDEEPGDPGGGGGVALSARGPAVPGGDANGWVDRLAGELLFGLLERSKPVVDLTHLGALEAAATRQLKTGEPSEVTGTLHQLALLGRVAGVDHVLASSVRLGSPADADVLRVIVGAGELSRHLEHVDRLAAECEQMAEANKGAASKYGDDMEAELEEYDKATAEGLAKVGRTLRELGVSGAQEQGRDATARLRSQSGELAARLAGRAKALRAYKAVLAKHMADGAKPATTAELKHALAAAARDVADSAAAARDYRALVEQVERRLRDAAGGSVLLAVELRLIDAETSRTVLLATIRLLEDSPTKAALRVAAAVVDVVAPAAAPAGAKRRPKRGRGRKPRRRRRRR